MQKVIKTKKTFKNLLLTTLSILPIIVVTSLGFQYGSNSKVSIKNFDQSISSESNLENNLSKNNLVNEDKKSDQVSIPTINDTNAKTLIIGKNIIHLNNKVIYVPGITNPLVSASLLTVFDENFNKVQEIILNSNFDKLSPVDANDVSKGIIISGWNEKTAIYYAIDIETQTIDEKSREIVDVPLNSYSVAGNFNKMPSVISVTITNNLQDSSIPQLELTITSVLTKISNKISIPRVADIPFNSIQLVDCISVNNKLYVGINYKNDGNPVGSDIILLDKGEIIPGGPTVKLPFSIKSMVNDDQAKKIYVQYSDINDGSIRFWSYSTINNDKFSQESAGCNKSVFSQMVAVTKLNDKDTSGIITLNNNKNVIRYYDINNLNSYKYDYNLNFFAENGNRISDIIYNKYTNKFNLFYSYDSYVDGIISWNFDPTMTSSEISDERYYTDIAPIHIRYANLVKLMNTDTWKNEYASCYAKNNLSNSFKDFLEIPTFFKNIQLESIKNKDNNFEIKTIANDNIGVFNLIVDYKVGQLKENINSKNNTNDLVKNNNEDNVTTENETKNVRLLDFNVTNFTSINPEDIKANIDHSSQLLKKTPTELKEMLENYKTKELTQEMIFDLFGIDKKFQKLDYYIVIKDYNVLGEINIEIVFPTVFNNANINSKAKTTNDQILLVNNALTKRSLENRFSISTERWFIPIVTISSIIVFAVIILTLWMVWGKKLYKSYLMKNKNDLLKEYESLKILTGDNCVLEDANGNVVNPMSLASTVAINENSEIKINFREEGDYFNKISKK
ncbi:hypothetical protein [Mycoplasmoides alvi]|uniref:hypothetical protein n=1 Tax=Mycoplasmoides alvi TaxID=78580 RepID=UPI00051B1D35|nr:hypothetical protein [Mycoplasmoides alvi]